MILLLSINEVSIYAEITNSPTVLKVHIISVYLLLPKMASANQSDLPLLGLYVAVHEAGYCRWVGDGYR